MEFRHTPYVKSLINHLEFRSHSHVYHFASTVLSDSTSERVLVHILQSFSVPDINCMRQISKSFNSHIIRTACNYTYLSSAYSDNEHKKEVPNLTMFKLLSRYKGVKRLKCHGRVNVAEILKYLELGGDKILELELDESVVDLSKLFQQKHAIKPGHGQGHSKVNSWKSSQIEFVALTNLRKQLSHIEIDAFSYACANLRHFDISGSTKFDNSLLTLVLAELDCLVTFIALRNPKVNNEVLEALGVYCPKLERIEIGGL